MFENLGNKLSNLGGSIKQGASTFAENIQLNSRIEAAGKDLKAAYAELGEKMYKEHAEAVPAELSELTVKIKEIEEYIAKTKAEVRALSGVRECPQCGNDVPKGQAFCTNCGSKMAGEAADQGYEPEKKTFCRSCGNEIKPGFAFCNMCGTKVEAAPVKEDIPSVNPYSATTESFGYSAEKAEEAAAPAYEEPVVEEPVVEETAAAEPVAEEPAEAPVFEEPAAAPAYEAPESVCPQCGNIVKPGMSFCNMCGSRLGTMPSPAVPAFEETIPPAPVFEEPAAAKPEPSCPQCGNIVKPEMSFCNMCGFRLGAAPEPAFTASYAPEPECPRCGNKVRAEALFCNKCGYKLK